MSNQGDSSNWNDQDRTNLEKVQEIPSNPTKLRSGRKAASRKMSFRASRSVSRVQTHDISTGTNSTLVQELKSLFNKKKTGAIEQQNAGVAPVLTTLLDCNATYLPVGYPGTQEYGSARQSALSRLSEMLEKFSSANLAASNKSKALYIYAATLITMAGVVLYFLAIVLRWTDLIGYGRWFLFLAPLCLVFALKEMSHKLARTKPALAQHLCFWLSFGNPLMVCHLASLYIDTGNYQMAEKLLSKASKKVRPLNLSHYIAMHAFLAAARSRGGSLIQAERLLTGSMMAAQAFHVTSCTKISATLLATTLNYGAEIEANKQNFYQALDMSEKAVELLSAYKSIPLELLLISLANAGQYNNELELHREAILYLNKAKELIDNIKDVKTSLVARVLANLGLALAKEGDSETGAKYLELAQQLAYAPDGCRERPFVNRAIAHLHIIAGQNQDASESYKLAIKTCQSQIPKLSYELQYLQQEYVKFLRKIGREGEAAGIEMQALQSQYDLSQFNFSEKPGGIAKIKPAVMQMAKSKSRFPVFFLIGSGFCAYAICTGGFRVAPFSTWVLFVIFATIASLKILAKYGPRSQEESSGVLLTVVAYLPLFRYVVPELVILPKKTLFCVLGVAMAILGLVQTPKLVPSTAAMLGLTAYEYQCLGKTLMAEESFNKARAAFDHVIAMDPGGNEAKHAQKNILLHMPKYPQADVAIEANMKALSICKANPSEARKIWQSCIAQYPNFEQPYIHLCRIYTAEIRKNKLKHCQAGVSKTKNQVKADTIGKEGGAANMDLIPAESKERLQEAESMAAKALEINPDNYDAQITMSSVKCLEGDEVAAQAYLTEAVNSSGAGNLEKAIFSAAKTLRK